MELIQCPLCKFEKAKEVKSYDFGMKVRINCPKCGYFLIMDYQLYKHTYSSYSKIKEIIFFIRKMSSESKYIELHYDKLDEIINKISYPHTIEDKTDLLLQFIIDNEKDLNNGFAIGSEHLEEFALNGPNDLRGLIELAIEDNLIKTERKFSDGGAHCKLTIKGRNRLKELKQLSINDKNKIVIIKNSHFSKTMTKALESVDNEILNGNPDHAHDRMHTFIHEYLLQLCSKLSLKPNKKQPDILELFSLIQQHLNLNKQSKVTISILRSLAKALKEINDIRNNKSLSHPNSILSKPEAMFVINTVKTIYVYLEERVK